MKHKRPSFGEAACVLSSRKKAYGVIGSASSRPTVSKRTASTRHAGGRKKAPGRALLKFLLAEVSAPVLATEKCSWLADEAIANRIAVIVTAAVAVIVGI